MLSVLPVNTAQWAVAGFYFSLGPTLARTVTGYDSPLIGGLMLAAISFSSAAAVVLARGIVPRTAVRTGAAALAGGVVMALAGVHWPWPAVALVGTVISGLGFGAAFSGSVRSLVPLAQAHERAALMAGFFAASYLAFSLPAIAAGLLTARFGLEPTAIVYGIAAAALALAAFLPVRATHAA